MKAEQETDPIKLRRMYQRANRRATAYGNQLKRLDRAVAVVLDQVAQVRFLATDDKVDLAWLKDWADDLAAARAATRPPGGGTR